MIGRLAVAAAVVVAFGAFGAVVMFPSGFSAWTAFLVGAWLTVLGALTFSLLDVRRDPAMIPAVRMLLVGGFGITSLVVASAVIGSASASRPGQWTADSPVTTAVDSDHVSGDADSDHVSGDADPGVAPDAPRREREERLDRSRSVAAAVEPRLDELDGEADEGTVDELIGPVDAADEGDRGEPVDVSSLPAGPDAPGDDRRRVSTTVPVAASPPAPGSTSPPAPGTTSPPAPGTTSPPAPGTVAPTPPPTSGTPAPAAPSPVTLPPSTVTVPPTSPAPATTTPATSPPASPPPTQPATTQPATTQPATTQPETTQPETTQPATTQPETTQPAPDRPKPNLPDHVPPHAGPKPDRSD
jgi:hypothetical protein